MTTNTQPQTQQSGGDELEHMLGHCMCHDDDMNCWYMRTWKSLDNGHKDCDEVIQLMNPLQKTVIEGYVQARELAARVDESIYTSQHTPEFYNLQEKYQWFKERQQQLQLKPQAGEGGEG